MKKIVILGAGIYQVPLIKKAKEMGLYTIVVSIKGNYPGFALADKIYYLNTTDADAIIQMAKEEGISGICTTGTDVAIPALGKVCDTLGLSGVSYEAAICAENKFDMKKKFMEGGVCTAKYEIAHNYEETAAILEKMSLPVMVKAVDSSGSRGITKIKKGSKEEVSEAIENAKKVSKQDYFIVEECIEGTEFGAQALIYHGKVQFIMPHGDYVFAGDTGVPVGHYVPYDISDELVKETKKQVELSTKALGVDNCAINADFILKEGKVYALEIGARAGATCLAEMVSIYFGIDYYKMLIDIALGNEIEAVDAANGVPNACKVLMADKTGTIAGIESPEIKDKNILDVSFDYNVGDHVNKFRIGPDRIGQVIAKGATLQEAVDSMNRVIEGIKIDITED